MLLKFSALSLVKFSLVRLSSILHFLNIYILGISTALSSRAVWIVFCFFGFFVLFFLNRKLHHIYAFA